MNPAQGGVSLNVGSLLAAGQNNTGGHTCNHAKNSSYEMGPMMSPTCAINMRQQDNRANLIQVRQSKRFQIHSYKSTSEYMLQIRLGNSVFKLFA